MEWDSQFFRSLSSRSYNGDKDIGFFRRIRARRCGLDRLAWVALGCFVTLAIQSLFSSTAVRNVELAEHVPVSLQVPWTSSEEDICDPSLYPAPESLIEEQVTILVNGFSERRLPLLAQNMQHYSNSPAVHSIFVLWGNVSSPQDIFPNTLFVSDGAPIYTVRQTSKSLNDRFLPRDFIKTKAVIICDDDITIDNASLEFALHVWQLNQDRIIGFFPRAHEYSIEDHSWIYRKMEDRYSIMLTKLMLHATEFLFKYTCQMPEGVHEYVDKGMNCEDIAMNFVVSASSGLGPILVDGMPRDWGDTRNSDEDLTIVALSARMGHKSDRGVCLGEFTRMFGGMHLHYSYYKASRDVSEEVLCDKFGYLLNCDIQGSLPSRSMAKQLAGASIVRKNFTYAYVTLVGQPELIPAAIVLAQSLHSSGTNHDLVLLVDETSSVNPRDELLLEHYDIVKAVPSIKNQYNVKGFNKLNAWLLIEYSKIIYIDVDTLVLANIDHLFDHPTPAAVPDVYMSGKFNSGLMVITPSKATFSDMMAKMDKLPSYNRGDQGFLNSYFDGWFQMPAEHRLPARYNAVIFFPEHYHPPKWFLINSIFEVMGPLAVVHFANPWFKPWKLAGNVTDNVWCTAWLRVSQALQKNAWHPLPPTFTPLKWIPNRADYAKPQPLQRTHVPIVPQRIRPDYAPEEGFITLVSDAGFFAAGVWSASFQQHHTFSSWRRTTLLVSSTLSPDLWKPYKQLFDHVQVVDRITIDGKELDEEFNLLHIFNQTRFDKLVYVDPLAFFLDNCHALLSYEPFAAAPSPFPPDSFSTRVMVVQPDTSLFNDMLAKLSILSYQSGSVERFLNTYFYDWFEQSPTHRIQPSYAVDMWFKLGLMKFFEPWKILMFDVQSAPWAKTTEDTALDRLKAIKLWRRTFCSLESEIRPTKLDYMCSEFGIV